MSYIVILLRIQGKMPLDKTPRIKNILIFCQDTIDFHVQKAVKYNIKEENNETQWCADTYVKIRSCFVKCNLYAEGKSTFMEVPPLSVVACKKQVKYSREVLFWTSVFAFCLWT